MKKLSLFLLLVTCSFDFSYAGVLHVAVDGSDLNEGNAGAPYKTISKAAAVAMPGDTVMIHGGTYREWVSPANSGTNPAQRIVYMAAENEEVHVKGSEDVSHLVKKDGKLWKIELPDSFFGDFNPFKERISGDWLFSNNVYHLGAVYVNGVMYGEVFRTVGLNHWPKTWLVEEKEDRVVVYFHAESFNPKKDIVEINARSACFFPKHTGVNYITVKGLKFSQACPQWAPPTALQMGMVGPNWSKGWVIEDCEVSFSKCVGISLGKEYASGQNLWTLNEKKGGFYKEGFTREIEAIIKAGALGWNKDNIGSHIVRNNIVHDCGQAGIVGHLGCVGSVIANNNIYNNNIFPSPKGVETAGIKLHASIDVRIENNYIHDNVRGIWLDWQAQGTHVAGNVMEKNRTEDLFIEVSHGPTLVYNNLLLSKRSLLLNAQGIACFNNLLFGKVQVESSLERYTPYHVQHSTEIKGFYNNAGGDIRFYNNIFVKKLEKDSTNVGLAAYDAYPAPEELAKLERRPLNEILVTKFPVWASGNVYTFSNASYRMETDCTVVDESAVSLEMEKGEDFIELEYKVNEGTVTNSKTKEISSGMLGSTLISEAVFDNPDATDFKLETDLFGKERNQDKPFPGPFEKSVKKRISLRNGMTF